ncbi:hypothetical protein AU255_09005 [Methyloprofundus sedimenti]|uniref:CRISPR type III-associated protein domain-containing protein n=1 Tax=Methyloprofundus sedimenti TaxID=1420851 RepID=A0A1V8M8Y7_9GAMM|nr:type III-B CRISPR module RAMP protein Cmr6 [Methyloprofundus sedimenti]OQK17977.1 hypothetical protein AU255_09005 [Methyloprofundus sedimenti]
MITPLYKEFQAKPSKPEGAHTGLWFDRFFNQYATDWTLDSSAKDSCAKKAWIKKVVGLTGDTKKLETFNHRQIALVAQLKGASQRYTSDWHFVTGMGNSHPVENGFSWHPTLAVPFLTGASVKGLVRAWVEMNDEGLSEELKAARLKSWFGTEKKGDVAEQAGDFVFFDALPDAPPQLACDIMTPHMGKWYSDGDQARLSDSTTIPADWHEPVPVPFLVVKKTSLVFHIAPRKKDPQAELEQVFYALNQALEWLGAGAKTAAGYGYMSEDTRYSEDLKTKLAEQQARQEKEQALKAKLADLSPLAQDYFRQADEGDWQNNKDKFLQAGLIEGWLDTLEENLDATILADMIQLLDLHIRGLLQDPDKVKGKPGKEKPVYKERQRKIAHRINDLR